MALVSPPPLGMIRLGFLPLLPPKPAQTVERKREREQEEEEVILHAAPDVIRISPSSSFFLPLFLPLSPSPKFPFPVAAAEYGGLRSYSHRQKQILSPAVKIVRRNANAAAQYSQGGRRSVLLAEKLDQMNSLEGLIRKKLSRGGGKADYCFPFRKRVKKVQFGIGKRRRRRKRLKNGAREGARGKWEDGAGEK